MNDKLKELITQPANFEESTFGYFEMVEWAKDDEGGGLPDVSARPFAAWLDGTWNEFDDGTGKQTNDNILQGAWESWTGRS